MFNKFNDEDIDHLSESINNLTRSILTFLLPFLIKGVIVFYLVSILFGLAGSITEEIKKNETVKVLANSTQLDLNAPLSQEFIEYNGIKYGMPLSSNLTKVQKLMLLGIRVPEFGGRLDSDLAGDLDSFCPYQQRVSELLTDSPVGKKAKQLLGTTYNDIFNIHRVLFINQHKNSQLRNVRKTVTFNYGVEHSFTGRHFGTDYNYFVGESVSTPLDGVVSEVLYENGGGNVVVIKHEKQKIRTLYAHLSAFKVAVGDNVRAGQVIGLSGDTGQFVQGAHLHFQIMNNMEGDWNSNTKDPMSEPYLIAIQASPFLAITMDLVSLHLRTGFCDDLALERLRVEPSTQKWVDRESIDIADLEPLAWDLCRSQRPIDCNIWVYRSVEVLRAVWSKI